MSSLQKQTSQSLNYILGLDIGSSSIGWSIVELKKNRPVALVNAGVRIFDAGVKDNISEGKDSSKSIDRREKRLARRQHWRRAQRKRNTLKTLQKYGLLPETPVDENQTEAEEVRRHQMINQLDKELIKKHHIADNHVDAQLLPYKLRALAVNQPVTLHELGRALYHLGQRRGFLSNRKTDLSGLDNTESGTSDENLGKVKSGINELRKEMGSLTLGEYFSTLSPIDTRIRQRWTARSMYVEEFNKIWDQQITHHDCLTPKLKREIYNAIFYQRPLKSQKGLIGKCELEPGKQRAALALPVVQEFRIIQAINNLVIVEANLDSRELYKPEKEILFDALQKSGELTYAHVRKLLNLHRKSKFSIEEGGEKRIIGNRTRAKIFPTLGDQWDSMTADEQDQVVYDLLHFQSADALARHARKLWGLDSEKSNEFANITLEQGYARHSQKALQKLVAIMRDGTKYATAKNQEYPESNETGKVFDNLPPIDKVFPDLRNPAVARALTELRKVVNNIVRKHGIPACIRIEMAKELKKSRKERKAITEKNRENEKRRSNAKKLILEKIGIDSPHPSDVEKVLLAEECNWICPYTGKSIEMRSLLGPESQFDIEHIFPRKYLDNSYINKTLCYAHENRHVKKDQLPYQAYHQNDEKWNEILDRVRTFKGPVARIKLERFQTRKVDDGFSTRQLNDTRYNSVLAAEFVGLLYGGRTDASGKMRVHTLAAGVTVHLRREWQLEGLLGGRKKNRDDHRHHAIDALVIALADFEMVKQLSKAAERASQQGSKKLFVSVQSPWNQFVDSVRLVIDDIKVSFRAKRKLAGPLEAGSNYSKAHLDENGKQTFRIRKPLENLSKKEVENIVDPNVRLCVKDKMQQLGAKDTSVFKNIENHPSLVSKEGRKIPIHKVRIQISGNPRTIGKGSRKRNVLSGKGSNHHAVILAFKDKKGNEKWEHHVVTRMEANRRLSKESQRAGEQVIQREWGPNKDFKFSICANDYLELDDEKGNRVLYRVSKLSAKEIQLWEHWQANPKESEDRIGGTFGNRIQSTDHLRKRNCRKLIVSPIGEITPAND